MLVYQSTKSHFLGDVENRGIEYDIAKAYLAKTGRYAPDAELRAWRHSLEAMASVLGTDDIAANAGIAVEFGIPQTSKRIDFLISGIGADGSRNKRALMTVNRPALTPMPSASVTTADAVNPGLRRSARRP